MKGLQTQWSRRADVDVYRLSDDVEEVSGPPPSRRRHSINTVFQSRVLQEH